MCYIFRSATAFSACQAVHHLPLIFQTFLDLPEQGIIALILRAKELEGALSRLEGRLTGKGVCVFTGRYPRSPAARL